MEQRKAQVLSARRPSIALNTRTILKQQRQQEDIDHDIISTNNIKKQQEKLKTTPSSYPARFVFFHSISFLSKQMYVVDLEKWNQMMHAGVSSKSTSNENRAITSGVGSLGTRIRNKMSER